MVVSDAFAVPTLKEAALGEKFQFERLGKYQNIPSVSFFDCLLKSRDRW